MFDLAELYAAWTEDPSSFWAQPDSSSGRLRDELVIDENAILNEDQWVQILSQACPPPQEYLDEAQAWLVVVINGLRTWSQRAAQRGNDSEELSDVREALEKYLFLTRLHLARLDTSIDALDTPATSSRRSASTGSIGDQTKELLDAVSRTVQSGLAAVFPATESAKRSSLALLYLEPTCRLLQHEIVVRDSQLAKEIVRLLSLGVKLQHQQSMVRTQLLQLLTFYEHAVPVTVQLLYTLEQQFDHTALAELVVKDLAAEAAEWTDTQNSATTNRAKCVNAFLQALTQKMPDLVASNLPAVSMLIGSPIPQLRQATLDVAAAIIHSILNPRSGNASSSDENDTNNTDGVQVPTNSLGSLALDGGAGSLLRRESGSFSDSEAGPLRYKPAFDLIQLVELRVNDLSHFCRLRAVQVLATVAREPALISRRDRFTEIAVLKMKDRTQLVRRQAMRLMKELIDSHPQIMHPNCLSRPIWQSSLQQIESQLEEVEPGDTRQQLEAARAFVQFTLKFIDRVDEAVKVAQTLLLSRSKSDVLDAIDLLVYADAYGVESSSAGIRAIVHLVWAKVDNDEGNSVCRAAVNTYCDLFMQAPPELDTRRGAQLIAENLIILTHGATRGELTSLERLLVLAVEQDMISVAVVGRLWGIYQTRIDIDKAKRRGAAIILSMLASADRSIACSGLGVVVEVGLSELGIADPEFAAYSFAILKRSVLADADDQRVSVNFELFDHIIDFLLLPADPSAAMQWTSLAKEALAAISVMCDCPPKVMTKLLKKYVAQVFGEDKDKHTSSERMQLFSQLIFLAGEIALNLLVYLERSELDFKRRLQDDDHRDVQAQGESANQTNQDNNEEELMAGGGSREDDFQDVLRDTKEEGILYSDKALLKPFTGIVIDICQRELSKIGPEPGATNEPGSEDGTANHAADADPVSLSIPDAPPQMDDSPQSKLLVMGATQTLSKFMCVSSHFCEENLPLLVDLMSRHENNVVRSNFVVALGDVAICFNRLIDEHTEYLYDRLNDSDPVVQRTCIVALTFLILAGQIKVKGKLGEMAKAVANPNRKISSLATMFFRELATKENAIYNSFLDMLSTLIADEQLIESDMLRILKFLAEFVDRERHMKQLTEKLVSRLPRCESQRQWNAYVQVLKSMPRKLDDAVKDIIAAGFSKIPGQENMSMTDQELNEEERQQQEQKQQEEHEQGGEKQEGESQEEERQEEEIQEEERQEEQRQHDSLIADMSKASIMT